jgi:hypothetical protein
MSVELEWVGKVTWHIDNKGVIENFWRMPSCVANDWCKIGDRDVFGSINHMQGVVAGVWDVKHQRGHECAGSLPPIGSQLGSDW